jgi:2-dehydro-3-deoxyphosphogalactonate aldolase
MSLLNSWTEKLSEMPLVAILRGLTPEDAVDVSRVLVDAGFKIIEVPLNSPEPFEIISKIKEHFGDQIIVGAGTVLTGEAARQVHDAGGELIVAPNLDQEVAKVTTELGMIYCPGILTPTEAFLAVKLGATTLKLFPADAHPPSYIKAIKAVLPVETTIMPTGGIVPENMDQYISVGADGLGLGSALYSPKKTLDEIAVAADEYIKAIKPLI